MNRDFEKVFTKHPIIPLRRNRNLQGVLGKKTIVNNKKLCQNITNF